MSRKKEIDQKDIEILNVIQEDASITNRDLAEKVGLTAGPTLVRTQNLEKNGYVSKEHHKKVNWTKLGFTHQSFVRVSLMKTHADKFKKVMKAMNGVFAMYELKRENDGLGNSVYFSIICVFRSEEEFTDAWSNVIERAKYPIDFQVWLLDNIVFENNPITIT